MSTTGKIGHLGHRPKVTIAPAKEFGPLTPEQKAEARAERRRKASEEAEKKNA